MPRKCSPSDTARGQPCLSAGCKVIVCTSRAAAGSCDHTSIISRRQHQALRVRSSRISSALPLSRVQRSSPLGVLRRFGNVTVHVGRRSNILEPFTCIDRFVLQVSVSRIIYIESHLSPMQANAVINSVDRVSSSSQRRCRVIVHVLPIRPFRSNTFLPRRFTVRLPSYSIVNAINRSFMQTITCT